MDEVHNEEEAGVSEKVPKVTQKPSHGTPPAPAVAPPPPPAWAIKGENAPVFYPGRAHYDPYNMYNHTYFDHHNHNLNHPALSEPFYPTFDPYVATGLRAAVLAPPQIPAGGWYVHAQKSQHKQSEMDYQSTGIRVFLKRDAPAVPPNPPITDTLLYTCRMFGSVARFDCRK